MTITIFSLETEIVIRIPVRSIVFGVAVMMVIACCANCAKKRFPRRRSLSCTFESLSPV